ncbi:MAG: MaoC family dehydratase N-terminal domain-containing protein [Chloroflexota bacterium]
MAGEGQITEEALAELRKRMGVEHPIREPYNKYATEDGIKHMARAIGDMNPLWLDEEYAKKTRWGGIIALPSYLYCAGWGSWDLRHGMGLPGVHGLHSGDIWTWYRPIRVGDRIVGTRKLADLIEKKGEYAGRMFLQIVEAIFKNQNGELLSRWRFPFMRTERGEGRGRGKYASIKKAHYTAEELKALEDDYDREEIRGAKPRYWEDVNVGDELTPVVKGPLTMVEVIAWVMGTGSPHIRAFQYALAYRRRTPGAFVINPETGIPEVVERVHWEDYLAQQIGMPAAYDYGSQRGAWATNLLTNWMGDDGWLKHIDVQFRGMNFLGDTQWIRGKVTDKSVKDGEHLVDVGIKCVNQRGDDTMPGTATVILPSKSAGAVALPIKE